MPFPEGLPTKRVHLTVTSPTGGTPASGTVRLGPNVPAVVIADVPVTFTGQGTYNLDAQGRLVDTDGTTLGVELLDNTAPGSNPAGWLWHAIVTTDGRPRSFYFSLGGTPDEVALDELQQLAPGVPQYVAVMGPEGPEGPAGTSAYGVAVANGFVGTEAEWLASLVGPQGEPGTGLSGGGAVASVNGLTGAVVLDANSVGADPAGAASAAQSAAISAAAADATAKVAAHTAATDPHGDRAAASAALAGHVAASDPHGDRAAASSALAAHESDTTSVHGIADTTVLETTSGAQAKADAAQAAATSAAASDATAKVAAHTAASDPHGDRAYADGKLAKTANLSDLNNPATARTNLGLGGAALLGVGTSTDTVAAGDDARITGAAQKASNLSDLTNPATARTNLGLGGAAVANVGTGAGTVAAGDDARITGALPATGGTLTGDLAITGRLTEAGFSLPMFPTGPRPSFRLASWSQQFQSGHGWTASGSGVAASNVNDTATFCRGTQSFQVVTTGTGAVANIRRLGSALPDLTGKALRLVVRISDVTHLNQINVQVGSSTLANTFSWRLHTHASTAENQVLSGEWAVMTLSWADVRSATGSYSISSTGVPSTTSGFTDLLFQVVDDNTGNPLTVNLQAVEVINDSTETFPAGVVSITFDDSYSSQYTYARPKMDSLGYRGTLYTICDVIGTGGYLTVPQLQSVQANSGWEVAGHAYAVANHNAKYNTLTASVVEDDIRKTRMWMASNGFPSDSFAYPGGWFSKTTDNVSIEALTCRYFSSGRGISSADNLESFPPPAPYRMRSITGIGSLAGASARGLPANLTGAGGSLDRCQLDGDWTILTFHEIVTGTAATTNQCSQTDFNTIMDAISARQIPVLPVGDVLRTYS